MNMGRDLDSIDDEDRLHAWIQGRDASSEDNWLQDEQNSDDALCNDSDTSAENRLSADRELEHC